MAESTALPALQVDLTSTYGAFLIGMFVSCAVWGVSCLQTMYYFHAYERDPLFLKTMVLILWIIDLANEIVTLKSIWPFLVSKWGDTAMISKLSSDVIHSVWISGLMAAACQTFFIRRVWILSNRKWWHLCSLLALLTAFQLFALIPYATIALRGGTVATMTGKIEAPLTISMRSCMLADDILITLSLLYLLLRPGIPCWTRSRIRLYRLLVVTSNTGSWTALLALAHVVLYSALPRTEWFCVADFPMCSVYFSTILANLNSRKYIRGDDDDVNEFISRDLEQAMTTDRAAPQRDHVLVLDILHRKPDSSSTADGEEENGSDGQYQSEPPLSLSRSDPKHPYVFSAAPVPVDPGATCIFGAPRRSTFNICVFR
ncbi:hypothetical protein OF83DRAFT_1290452 [Amylostereum chailletii]|nr:hypothetical protein OF83DRAFT_1290452 [Amylostereum chailletii]